MELQAFDGKIHVFKAMHRNFYIPDKIYLGWKPYAKDGVIVHNIPGDHSHIFAEPNNVDFAKILQKALDESYESFTAGMH